MNSVGIDISKGRSTIAVMRPFGEVVISPFEVRHTDSELSELARQLKSLDGETRVVMEATGNYHALVAKLLHDAGLYHVHRQLHSITSGRFPHYNIPQGLLRDFVNSAISSQGSRLPPARAAFFMAGYIPENRRLYAVFRFCHHHFADPCDCPRRWPWCVGCGQSAGGLWLGQPRR